MASTTLVSQSTRLVSTWTQKDNDNLVQRFREVFIRHVDPKLLIFRLPPGSLTGTEEEMIQAEQTNNGPTLAAWKLLQLLSKRPGWVPRLLNGLRESEVGLAFLAEKLEHFQDIIRRESTKHTLQNTPRLSSQQYLPAPVTHPESLTPRSSQAMARVQLDADQQDVLKRWNKPKTVINAGPGSGKTTTLCELIAHILQKQPDKRILALAFNVYASNVLHERLKERSVTLQEKYEAFDSVSKPGCLVITFDSFGFWSSKVKNESAEGNYRQSLEKSIIRLQRMDKSGTARKWDWVIVDEAQDLNETHALLVETLRETSSHLVVAGDPRQEVYSGVRWFSKLLQDTELKNIKFLRNNYRSTPQIVEVLNRYCRHHFPGSVHVDLISKREDCQESTVEFWQENPDDYQETIGDRLSLSEPKDAYGITPVSVDAFQNEHVTKAVRQVLYEKRPLANTFVYGKSELLSCGQTDVDGYILGTPFGLKGTERSRVVLYGVTSPYKVIKPDALKRLIFVAMSRARDHLHIIANRKLPFNSPLCCFSEFTGRFPKSDWSPENIPVLYVTKLAREEYVWRHSEVPLVEVDSTLTPVYMDAVDDHDIVALYLGNVVAFGLGILSSFSIQIGPVNWQRSSKIEDEILMVPGNISDLPALQELVSESNLCYASTVAPISVDIGRIWTKSSRLKHEWKKHCDECKEHMRYIHKLSNAQDSHDRPQHCQKQVLIIKLHRSNIEVGKITSCPDFMNPNMVANVKYAPNITPTHRAEAAIQGAMANVPAAYVINLRGDTEKVIPASLQELMDRARAKVALDAAKTSTFKKRPMPPVPHPCSCYIAVSVIRENDMNIEMGAVAFSINGDLRGTYHRILQGVSEIKHSDSISPVTSGLVVTDAQSLKKDQQHSEGDFRKWTKRVSDFRCFLYWRDRYMLADYECLDENDMTEDLHRIVTTPYDDDDNDDDDDDDDDEERIEIDDTAEEYDSVDETYSQSGLTLQLCLKKVFQSHFQFVPHRAFENAVGIATLTVALCKI